MRRLDGLLSFFLAQFFRLANRCRPDLLDGQDLLHDQALCDDGLELVVYEIHRIDIALAIAFDDALGQVARLAELQLAQNADVLPRDLHCTGALP